MRVVVVGGGLSGTAFCLRLLKECASDVHITLVERRAAQLARGVAYSAQVHQQLLNVPAGRMGLFPEAPDGFLTWLKDGAAPGTCATDFMDRHSYGDHIESLLQGARRDHPGRLQVRIGEAIAARREGDGLWRVTLAEGDELICDRLVLSLGNAHPANVPGLSMHASTHPHYAPWPWQPGLLRRVGSQEHVLFVGSGLTMVDLLLSLKQQGHTGPCTVLSRRGQLPRAHAQGGPFVIAPPPARDGGERVSSLLRWVRAELARAEAIGVPWQSVIDAVRHYVQSLWQDIDRVERARFLRHLRPHWDIHRHRMPITIHDRIHAHIVSGIVNVVAGRIDEVRTDTHGFHVRYQPRGSEAPRTLLVDRIINCTGPQSDVRRLDQPLLRDLLANGHIVADPLGLGIDCTSSGAVRDGQGRISSDLFVLGPLCKGVLWECTAVPEIREQVRALVSERFTPMPQRT